MQPIIIIISKFQLKQLVFWFYRQTSINAKYPVIIILQLQKRIIFKNLIIATKLNKPLVKTIFSIGDGLGGQTDMQYKFAGQKQIINQNKTQVSLSGIGNFLKITISQKPQKTYQNPFKKSSIGLIKIWGQPLSYGIKLEEPINDRRQRVDKILIQMGIPYDCTNWKEGIMNAPLNEKCRITLIDIQKSIDKAIRQQDYMFVKKAYKDIIVIYQLGKNMLKIQRDIEMFVGTNIQLAQQRFQMAIKLKDQLIKLQKIRENFDAIYETSLYEHMLIMERPKTSQYQSRVLQLNKSAELQEQKQRLKQQNQMKKYRQIMENSYQKLKNQYKPWYQNSSLSESKQWNDKKEDLQDNNKLDKEMQQKNIINQSSFSQKNKKKQKIKKEAVDDDFEKQNKIKKNYNITYKSPRQKELTQRKIDFSDPLKFNEGDLDLQKFLNPLLKGHKIEEGDKQLLRRYLQQKQLTVFGSRAWAGLQSENWRIRQACAQAVCNFLQSKIPQKYLKGKSKYLFLSSINFSKICCQDKLIQIYLIGLNILQHAFQPPVCGDDVSPIMINNALKQMTPIIIQKISQSNPKARDASLRALLNIYSNNDADKSNFSSLVILIYECLKICKNQKQTPLFIPPQKQQTRILMARLQVNFNNRLQQKLSKVFNSTPKYAQPALFHASNEVRSRAQDLICQLFKMGGQEVQYRVNHNIEIKPAIIQKINQKLQVIKLSHNENKNIQLNVIQQQPND